MNKSLIGTLIVSAFLVAPLAPASADGGHDKHEKKTEKNMHAEAVMIHAKITEIHVDHGMISISHGVVKKLGWAAKTSNLKVSKKVDLSALKVGQELMMSVSKDHDGGYMVSKVMMH
jgi:Cu/Ag efflux protein CusF